MGIMAYSLIWAMQDLYHQPEGLGVEFGVIGGQGEAEPPPAIFAYDRFAQPADSRN